MKDDEKLRLVNDPPKFPTLTINPGRDPAPRNPLCPVCEDEIRPVTNGVERRFVCGCEQLWKFTFEDGDSCGTQDGGCDQCGADNAGEKIYCDECGGLVKDV